MRALTPILAAAIAWAMIFTALGAQPDVKPPKVDGPVEIGGIYSLEGKDAKGGSYHGVAIIEKVGEVYRVQFSMSGMSTVGVGVRTGDYLATGWLSEIQGGVARGATLYKIQGQTLTGKWATLPGNGRTCVEKLRFLKDLPTPEDE